MKKNISKDIKAILEVAGAMRSYYPANHKLGMIVPKGGSMCAKCRFVNEEKTNCVDKGFQRWNANVNKVEDPSLLPAPADEYCCDLFIAKK